MKHLAVVTVARSDYGIYRPLLDALHTASDFELSIIATGMHLDPRYGYTVAQIEADGFTVAERVESLVASDTAGGVVRSMGLGLLGFAAVYERNHYDMVMVLGDRFDMIPAAQAALPFRLPVAHLHGGELTVGAMDDALRHAITKLSHLHFTATESYARRVIRMGESPWRVTVSGAPSLDHLTRLERLPVAALKARFSLHFEAPPLLVTLHPATLESLSVESQVNALLDALATVDLPVVITAPNADPGSDLIRRRLQAFAQARAQVDWVENFGAAAYFSMMAAAAAMVGNSSSGILEAASFHLPVVNIGRRQEGRVRGGNVIDVPYDAAQIVAAIQQATDPAFRTGLRDLVNPYGDGHAVERILQRLREVSFDDNLLLKRFHDG